MMYLFRLYGIMTVVGQKINNQMSQTPFKPQLLLEKITLVYLI